MNGFENRSKGKLLEQQVATFLEKRGWLSVLGRRFRGRIAIRTHDCDIFAGKRNTGWTFVTVVCCLLTVAGIAHWVGWSPQETRELLPIAWVRWLDESSWTLNWLAPTAMLLGPLAAKWRAKYVWIECKNLQQSIRRDLVMKLKDQFRDAKKPRGDWQCWLVSTSRFDEDAVAHAKAHGVRCYQVVDAGGRGMALHEVRATTGDV